MSIAGLVFGLIVLLAMLVWISAPLRQREKTRTEDSALLQKQRERLLLFYERVLTNIRDLDEDLSTGKMASADYEAERETWVQRGIQVLKALDRLDAQLLLTTADDDAGVDQVINEEIEAAVARYREKAR
jgi:hypothetical protein